MAEYIDRQALLKKYCKEQHKGDCKQCDWYGDTWCRGKLYGVQIAEFPIAADVAPVRHGRWLTWEEMFPGQTPKKKNNLGVFCDQCKNHADNRADFCPNCGAKMDGGESE